MNISQTTFATLIEQTEPLLAVVEQAVTAAPPAKTITAAHHPPEDLLRQYVRGQLHQTDAVAVRGHLARCLPCANDVLNIMRRERELWRTSIVTMLSFPAHLVTWVSELWQPEGLLATAAGAAEQTTVFAMREGEIELSCAWQSQEEDMPAHIRLSWVASLVSERELYALFFDPDTKTILKEIPLGTYSEGGKNLTSEALGFNPALQPWGIAIALKGYDP